MSGLRPAQGANETAQIRPDGSDSAAGYLRFQQHNVTASLFDLYGIARLQGRHFEPSDDPNAVILGAPMAAAIWPDGNSVGRSITWSRLPDSDGEPIEAGATAVAPEQRL